MSALNFTDDFDEYMQDDFVMIDHRSPVTAEEQIDRLKNAGNRLLFLVKQLQERCAMLEEVNLSRAIL